MENGKFTGICFFRVLQEIFIEVQQNRFALFNLSEIEKILQEFFAFGRLKLIPGETARLRFYKFCGRNPIIKPSGEAAEISRQSGKDSRSTTSE
jgi:hypothetical protein